MGLGFWREVSKALFDHFAKDDSWAKSQTRAKDTRRFVRLKPESS